MFPGKGNARKEEVAEKDGLGVCHQLMSTPKEKSPTYKEQTMKNSVDKQISSLSLQL